MTWLDVILYGPGWLACLMLPLGWWMDRRFRRQRGGRRGVDYREERP